MSRLSHSAVNKYLDCAKSYELHYVKKYRERSTSSALLFGTALDGAINALLEDIRDEKFTRDLSKYKEVFSKLWYHGRINKDIVALPESLLMGYAESEMQWELLSDDALRILDADAKDKGLSENAEEAFEKALVNKKQQKFGKLFSEVENKFYNLCNWYCLSKKGHLMIEAYVRDIVPKLKSVRDVQIVIKGDNTTGDSVIGYIDAIVEWENGNVMPIDNKTSSRLYDLDSVRTSQQLGLYCEFTGYDHAAFFVMLKYIDLNRVKTCSKCSKEAEKGSRHKTCAAEIDGERCAGEFIEKIHPEAKTQVVMDKVSTFLKDNVIDTFDQVARAVAAEIYPRNLNSCVKPWGRCAYYKLCHEGNDNDLEKDNG